MAIRIPIDWVSAALAMSLTAMFSVAPSEANAQDPFTRPSIVDDVQDRSVGAFPALVVPDGSVDGETPAIDQGLAGPIVTTVSSLTVVLAVFGALVWVSRRYGSTRAPVGALPEDVLRHLGGASIDAKTRVSFLKVGRRILVIGQTQTGDPQTLSEITDPEEVERLTNRCLGRPEIVGRRARFTAGEPKVRQDLAAG